jgi:hypothetical protein
MKIAVVMERSRDYGTEGYRFESCFAQVFTEKGLAAMQVPFLLGKMG